ncbi:MAG: hypothetical protein C4531_13615 [Desulfurivibrio sp.]|jgi:hypothetical protein|nr:MAG: hypothetical protein C4531_13615 [Desulfurivibrio sp.]
MDINALIASCQLFFQDHKAMAAALVAALALFGYLKPKIFFKLLLLALFAGVVLYIVSLLGESSTTGIEQKDQMMYKSKEILE